MPLQSQPSLPIAGAGLVPLQSQPSLPIAGVGLVEAAENTFINKKCKHTFVFLPKNKDEI